MAEAKLTVVHEMAKLAMENEQLKLALQKRHSTSQLADDVQYLARLPSRSELQATIVGSIQAPLAQMVGVLTAAQGNLVRVLVARGAQE